MKIILIDPIMYAHHVPYFEGLAKNLSKLNTVLGIVPEGFVTDACKLIHISLYKEKMIPGGTYINAYIHWINKVYKIIEKENPDIVHFLYGDIFYRYFGIGIRKSDNYKLIITLHQIRRSKLRDISIKKICHKASHVVVHTDKLRNDLKKMDIRNAEKIEYPYFSNEMNISKTEARKVLNIDIKENKMLLALGSTRYDKGLDILLEALNKVECKFFLLIAGNKNAFDEQYIKEHAASYINDVKIIMHYLSKSELELCLLATDYIVLPYRKIFDGASGPLGEGVAKEKIIIGPDNGSLGEIIKNNHLGYLFESENINDLAKTINKALSEEFVIDDKYKNYSSSLSVTFFSENYIKVYEKD